jgi:Mg/Co/Ni transporter MgtE
MAPLTPHLDGKSDHERLIIFELLKPEGAGEVLLEVEPPVQERILSDLGEEAIKEIVEELDSDDAADLVGDLPADRAREIIDTVEGDVSQELKQLLPYPEDSAGGIRHPRSFHLPRVDHPVLEVHHLVQCLSDAFTSLSFRANARNLSVQQT